MSKYEKFGTTISSLAREYGTSNPTIRNWLNVYDIPIKSHRRASGETNSLKRNAVPDKEELIERYDSIINLAELAASYGVGLQTLYQWMEHHGIQRRSLSESAKLSKTRLYADIQFDALTIKDVLDKYDQNKILAAEELNISLSHIKTLIDKYEIETQMISYKSKAELDLFDFCKTERPDVIWESGNRSAIAPYELDIFSPELNIAIEYCGLYWHSEHFGQKSPSYHRSKYLRCKDVGIQLFTIFEYDDLQKVKSFLRKRLGNTSKRLYARNAKIVTLSAKDAKEFHDTYHLNGSIGASVNYGLAYDDIIYLVASFGKSRFNKDYDWECTRCTSRDDYLVVGGVSKLFAHFINTNEPNGIITYADLKFGEGLTYLKCGFDRMADTPANYWYFHKSNPIAKYSRVAFQKHKLKTKLEKFDANKTEYENMLMNKWDRIWDCGNAKYVWKRKEATD